MRDKGLIPGKSVDLRKVRPFTVRGNNHLYELVREYKDVISGHAEAVKLPRAAVIEQHTLGRKSKHGRVLIPKSPTEKVKVRKDGMIELKDVRKGVTRIDIPKRPNESLRKYAERVGKIASKERGGSKYVGYELYGHGGSFYFEGPDAVKKMVNAILTKYQSRINHRDIRTSDLIDHLVILKSNSKKAMNE